MRLGILGAGQLAQMLAAAGQPLGIESLCYATADHCASRVTKVMLGDFSQPSLLEFAQQVDVITFENENVAAKALKILEEVCPIYPNRESLTVSQDRLLEKNLFTRLQIPTPHYIAVDSLAECIAAMQHFNYPLLLKTRRLGYDGKGQYRINTLEDFNAFWTTLSTHSCILEQYIPFQHEVSMIAVRDRLGSIVYYPLTFNNHQHGILRYSVAPWLDEHIRMQAEQYTQKILETCDYVGVLAVEFFCTTDGQLLANEIAPRVHNSGHWTMDGALCSQFENHVRAIFGLPLGLTAAITKTAMFNCIGQEPLLSDVLKVPGSKYHHYGKAAQQNRKLAHINLLYADEEQFDTGFQIIQSLVW